jgi:hypothetical protein
LLIIQALPLRQVPQLAKRRFRIAFVKFLDSCLPQELELLQYLTHYQGIRLILIFQMPKQQVQRLLPLALALLLDLVPRLHRGTFLRRLIHLLLPFEIRGLFCVTFSCVQHVVHVVAMGLLEVAVDELDFTFH